MRDGRAFLRLAAVLALTAAIWYFAGYKAGFAALLVFSAAGIALNCYAATVKAKRAREQQCSVRQSAGCPTRAEDTRPPVTDETIPKSPKTKTQNGDENDG